MNRFVLSASGLLALCSGSALAQQVVPASRLLQVNDTINIPGHGTFGVSALFTPATNTAGEIGFIGSATDGLTTHYFVWSGTGVIFSSLDAPVGTTFVGMESTLGLGTGGRWICGPSIDDEVATARDAIWSNRGLIQAERDPAPGAPGLFLKANSSPLMFGDSGAAWVSTTSTSVNGPTSGRLFYRMSNEPGATPTVVFRIGDIVFPAPDNYPIKFASPTISFKYEISDNGLHHIHSLGLDTGSTLNDGYIYLDHVPVAREGSDTGSGFGQLWGSFSQVAVNNAGQYMVYGLAAGSANSDATLNMNGSGVILEQDPYAGVNLVTPALVRAITLNNNGVAAFIWAYGPDIDPNTSGTQQAQTLFIATDITNYANTGLAILNVGDRLDFNGDGAGDAIVSDFRPDQLTSPGIDLAEDGRLAIRLFITDLDGSNGREAIVVLDLPLGCAADWNHDGGVDGDDVIAFFSEWDAGNADYTGDGGTDGDDVIAFFADWDTQCN